METPLIPRQIIFGNPDKAMVQISPEGEHIAYLAPRDGVLNVWVAPRDKPEQAQPVTADTGRGIRFYTWAYTSRHLLYVQDRNGDENWHLYRVDLETRDVLDLTPFEGVQAQLVGATEKHPEQVLVAINNRQPELHDVYNTNLISGEMTLIEQNEGFVTYIADEENHLVLALRMTPDGGYEVFRRADGQWQAWESIPQEDSLTLDFSGTDRSGECVYIKDSRGRNTAALFEKNLRTGETRLIAEDPRSDAIEVIRHPTEKHVQAVSFIYDRKRWQVIDPAIQPDLEALAQVADGELSITARSLDDRYWTVNFESDDRPVRYYIYDRQNHEARFLFTNRKDLESYSLAKMHPVVIPSRDGLNLVCFYSLPVGSDPDGDGIPEQPLPMVLIPHGGPWARDYWGLEPWHQWLANRGYAVMMVNFRSSTGLGKDFINAGDYEWGGKIIEDQEDAVLWAVEKGIADPAKVAIFGGSFGGYSVLAGLTFFPERYACGVDIVGPSNLFTLLNSIPPYWKPMRDLFTSRMGNPDTEEGRVLLEKHSPITHVERIQRPLLIAQGANDPRVKQAESDQIVEAMKARGIPVTYVLYHDEGHGFARPQNRLSFHAIAEAFLSKCLGGRYEPVGQDFEGSNFAILQGKADVPGL